ncbi:MAG TPA: hypothetical protein VK658_28650 [Chryseolinea sp.]|nr:hypothetical protein [Chryseolinea sp.]
MPLKTLVKVGSLTNLSDARYCAGMDVQLLGVQAVTGLPNYLSPARFQEIRGWIAGPSIVAEVHGVQSIQEIESIIEAYRPDYLELGIAELLLAETVSLPVIVRVKPGESFDHVRVAPAYALVDAGDTRSFEVPRIVRVSSLEDAKRVLDDSGVSGMALQGSDELSPGLKTYDTLAPILEMLEDD